MSPGVSFWPHLLQLLLQLSLAVLTCLTGASAAGSLNAETLDSSPVPQPDQPTLQEPPAITSPASPLAVTGSIPIEPSQVVDSTTSSPEPPLPSLPAEDQLQSSRDSEIVVEEGNREQETGNTIEGKFNYPRVLVSQPDKVVNQPTFSRLGTEKATREGEIPEGITVTEFKFTGNTETAISTEELKELIAGFTNKPLSQSELRQIAAKVAQLYADKGYNTSGAEIVIPDDTRLNQKGVVEIQVIEDELEEIKLIPGNILGVSDNYVRSRLELTASKPLNVQALKQSLQRLQLDPLIEKISAKLSPGSRPGKRILEVKVEGVDSVSTQHRFDQSHSPRTDSFPHRTNTKLRSNVVNKGDKGEKVLSRNAISYKFNTANLLVSKDKENQTYTNTDSSMVESKEPSTIDVQIVPTLNLAQVPNREVPTTPPPQDVLPPSASPSPVRQTPTVPSAPLENQLRFTPSPDLVPERVPETVPEMIIVERFEFSDNTVFTSAELGEKIQVCISTQSPQEISAQSVAEIQVGTAADLAEKCQEPSVQKPLSSISNQPFSLTQLLQIAAAIAKLYANQGYSTSGAEVEIPQETQLNRKGVVKIKVIEGELEEIRIIPGDILGVSEGYVRSRLERATSKPLNVERLKQALQLLLLDPLIEKVSARLSAGSRPGNNILEVEVEGTKPFSTQVSIDNSRSPSVGSFQRRSRLDLTNLLVSGDRIGAAYSNTDGSDALELSYTLPLNPRNGTLEIAYNRTESDVIEPPFNDIDKDGSGPDIESTSRSYEVTLRQPIIQTIKNEQTFEEFNLGLTASLRDSETFLLNIPFALSPGADQEGHTRLFALRFFQEWTQQNPRYVLAFRSQFNFGLDAFNSTTNEPLAETGEDIPDSRFFSWQGQAQWVRVLAPDTLLLLRGNLQLADQVLLSSEQFAVGGFGSVRGYRQDTLLTDNGISASAEVWLPILRVRNVRKRESVSPKSQTSQQQDAQEEGEGETTIQEGVLQVIPFFDYGTTWNSSGTDNPDSNTLSSFGIGLQWRQNNFTARLDWGIPLISVDSRDRTWQENGLYFSVQWHSFF